MKIGIKLWSGNSEKYIRNSEFADFVEVLPEDLRSVAKFAKYKREYTVHVPHEYFGFSPLDNYKHSLELAKRTVKAAKKLKATWMVMHTGRMQGNGDIQNAIKAAAKLAKEVKYNKLILENSTVGEIHKGESLNFIGYDYEQIKQLMEESGAGFCLDFEHAAITAAQLGEDFRTFVKKLMKLGPDYFHLSGTKPDRHSKYGHHLSIFETSFDINFVKETIRKAGKLVCLETPLDIEQRKKEVEFLKNDR